MTLIISILLLFLQAGTQDTEVRPAADTRSTPSQVQDPPGIPASSQPVRRPMNPDRPPLLREGTLISRAVGSIEFRKALGSWVFVNEVSEDQATQGFRRSFYLLPSRSLQEFTAFAASESSTTRFELYGTVTVYDGVNFILPSLITPLDGAQKAEKTEQGGESTKDPADPELETAPTNTLDSGASSIADRLEVRLQDRIGFMPMSLDVPETEASGSNPGLIPDGTRLQNRSGTIVRDQRTGAWRFLFETQGSGRRDPSIELLPCLLLQDIENRSMSNDLPTRIHVSGVVSTFRKRNYLLLSLWRPGLSSGNLVR